MGIMGVFRSQGKVRREIGEGVYMELDLDTLIFLIQWECFGVTTGNVPLCIASIYEFVGPITIFSVD